MRTALLLALALGANGLPAAKSHLRGPRDDEAGERPLTTADESITTKGAISLPLPDDERRRLSASSCQFIQLSGARTASLNGGYVSDGTCNGQPKYKRSTSDHWLYMISGYWVVGTTTCDTTPPYVLPTALKLYGRPPEVAPASSVIRMSSYSFLVNPPRTQEYDRADTPPSGCISEGATHTVDLGYLPGVTSPLQAWACASPWNPKATMSVTLGNYGLAERSDSKAWLEIRMEGSSVRFLGKCYKGTTMVWQQVVDKQPANAPPKHFYLPSACVGADRVEISCGGHCGVCRIVEDSLKVVAKTGWSEDDNWGTTPSNWQPNCDVATKCGLQARLAGSDNIYEGRVEVKHQGQWGSVCDDLWDINDAHVVCRQIFGLNAVEAKKLAFFGRGSGPTWLDDLACTGTEPALSLCPRASSVECYDGYLSQDAGVVCQMCPDGSYAKALASPTLQNYECATCDAGKASNAGRTACDDCPAGTVSAAGQGSCATCGPGEFSEAAGQASPCMKCGADITIWDQSWWDPNQNGLTNKNDCLCRDGRTGASCELEECAATTPVVSLGFLLLEAQWPPYQRTLSRNEDFSYISGAFRNFDTDGNNYLSVAEAQDGIADGGIAVPRDVRHIWNRGGERIFAPATACTADAACSYEGQFCLSGDGYCCQGLKWKPGKSCRTVTITDMVNDELQRLETQGTIEYHKRSTGSGDIADMKATYPSRLMENSTCAAQNTEPPKLDWSLERKGKTIFKQCAYFNGERLTRDEGLADSVASGGPCNDVPAGQRVDDKCTYKFQLPNDYVVTSYTRSDCTEPGEFVYEGRKLRCINFTDASGVTQLVDALEVEDAPTSTCKHTDPNSCPAGYDIWVPRSYDHAKAVVDGVDPKFTHLVGVYGTTTLWPDDGYPSNTVHPTYAMESSDAGAVAAGWTSVAGTPWFLRNKNFSEPNGDYVAGSWLTTSWGFDAYGFRFNDAPPNNYCFDNYLCSRNKGTVLDISTHSYCVETKFCPGGVNCSSSTADPTLTAMRCTTGLQYDGTVWDVFPRMLGKLGISLQWLDTRFKDTTGFRVYKVKDANTPFADDTSALLLREFVVRKAQCGLTFKPLEFLDLTTGSEPGFDVGYVVVPMDEDFDEVKSEAGSSGFIVPWFGDIRVNVQAKGGGPVKNVTVKVSHLLSDGTLDPAYIDFAVAATDDFGDALLPVRVHDRKWSDLSQHFRVTVEKNSTKANGDQLVHTFEPPSEDAEVRHLGEGNLRFVDNTAVSITGTVSHDRFDAQWYAYDCPHKMSDDATCMCPVDGVEVILTRASGAIEEVTVNDGKFSTSAFQGERVTLGLRMYNGSATGTVPHNFSVSHDAGANATTADGQEPTFTYTADEDAVVEFLDLSTQRLAATLVVGAGGPAAEYVTGMPVVARSKRCGWQKWQWAFKGATEFVLGAATAFDVRTLGVDEVTIGKYYYPPRDENPDLLAASCDTTPRADVVDGEATIRGCRATIPVVETCDPSAPVPKCQTVERPCAIMDGFTYVDQLPKDRYFERDLSILGTAGTNSTNSTNGSSATMNVDFVVTSPLCLASVSAAAASGTTLQSLLELSGPRENAYKLSPQENLLLSPPTDFTPPSDSDLYGSACLADTDAVFREGDAVDFNFTLVEREPQCFAAGVWPWDAGNLCSGYKDAPITGEPISIQIDDGLSGIQATAAYDEDPYVHAMIAAAPNPFAPFTHAMSLKFTRAFDGSAITFLRHAMLLGSIPEEVPQVWTVATNPTLIFMIIRDPPGGSSTTTLVEGSTISTSMAIDGAHAAELAETYDAGFGAGAEADLTTGVCFGGLASTKILGVGGNAGISYSHASPDVTVNRASSRHFDVSMSFSIGITTSNEEDLAGQPSDLIIGGGANLRFISSVEVYATASTGGQLCVHGRDTKQFLPEQVTTYVMSVYEIEQTMERLGAALRNPNATKLENVNASSLYDPKADIELQIKNWQTVLADYRKVTAQDATSIADVLEGQLNALHEAIAGKPIGSNTGFLYEAEANGLTTFSQFLDRGLDLLESNPLIYHRHRDMGLPDAAKAEGADMAEISNKEKKASLNRHRMKLFEKDVKDRVIKAGTRCVDAVGLVEPGNRLAPLCRVYSDIRAQIDLKHKLMGLCDHETGLASVETFCERDHYRDRQKIIGAFDALHDTTEFITFSGGTALNLRWTIGEARGEGLKSKHSASVADSLSGSLHLGGQVGRRLLGDGDTDDALAGYAYPPAGRHSVLAVSKKLLEVAPEALAERRRLQRARGNAMSESGGAGPNELAAAAAVAGLGRKFKGSKCRRRLGDEELSAEERRLGITFCGDFSGTESMSFDVELSRAASRNSGQTQEVVVHLKDDNPQDVFAVQIAMDPVHGTPIFTTLGGRSSCPGETGTTKRDSRVTLEDIKHLCRSDGEKCDGPLKCRCDDEAKPLAPGEPAIFSAIVQNLSPWQTEVMYMIRAVKTVTAWDAGKDTRVNNDTWDGKCPDGDPGSLSIKTLDMMNLRAPGGATITPLPYGQYELRFEVKRPDFEPQCSTFKDIELELVPMCERIHGGDPHSIYIYRTSEMDDKGNVKVVHPAWDNSTYDFTPATKALGYASSKKSFSVAWSRDVKGCRYADASNYNPAATVDDASCTFDVPGCIYAKAVNYDPKATVDDHSCVFSKMTKKFQSLACDADEPLRTYSSACRVLQLKDGAVFSKGLTAKWWSSAQKCAQRSKDKDSAGKLKFHTNWCPAAPFECTVPNSCLLLNNNLGVVRTVNWLKTKAKCLAKADAAGKFVVKWCPAHLADFATDSPTPRPRSSTTTAT